MAACMRGALADAGLGPEAVDYVSAHATATLQGDREEAEALREVFGARPAVSSLKGHLGHTLGASGAIELAAVLAGAEAGWTFPTRNLAAVADDCGGLDHVVAARRGGPAVVLKNSFAFGGISASLVCRREPPADPAGRTVP
jgi:3-oxoacyl-[acyl-carrier-protein] synthase II